MGVTAAGLTGCGGSSSGDNGELNIFIWTEYVPDSVISDFESEFGITVNASTFSTNEDMASELGVSQAALDAETSRAPMRPVEMRVLGNEEDTRRGDAR